MLREEDRFDSLIRYYAELNNLEWLKIKAQIKAESNFNPGAESPVGAKGLGQFMNPTWREWGNGFSVLDPEANIDATCRYMRWLLRQFDQDERHALAAYNWGIGNLKKLLARLAAEEGHADTWIGHLPDETAKYLVKINQFYVDYQHEILKRDGRTGQT